MPDPLKAGTLLHKRYVVGKVLGQGSFGTVYQARDERANGLGRQVAIKQMPSQMIVDCERQADLRAALSHPAIPRVLDYFATEPYAYLVQELVRGATLETLLDRQAGCVPEPTVVGWAIQLCGALAVLHDHPDHPVVFRDLKPNNLMADRANRVYLVDFGLARAFPPGFFEARQPRFRHLRQGCPIGTEGYSPPEQYRGRVTPRSDIYALGATLHHLLTRRDPRKERPFTFQQHPVRSLNPAISAGLEAIVMRAVQPRQARRFVSAREMRAALEALECRGDSRNVSPPRQG